MEVSSGPSSSSICPSGGSFGPIPWRYDAPSPSSHVPQPQSASRGPSLLLTPLLPPLTWQGRAGAGLEGGAWGGGRQEGRAGGGGHSYLVSNPERKAAVAGLPRWVPDVPWPRVQLPPLLPQPPSGAPGHPPGIKRALCGCIGQAGVWGRGVEMTPGWDSKVLLNPAPT